MINYYLITKPGIIMGNLITVMAGFLLASKGEIHLWLFLSTLLGLAFIMASACIFNNYIDRQIDQKMDRTKNRALAQGLISHKKAIALAVILGILGNVALYFYTNTLALCIADIGFIVYVILYSIWKVHTIYGTAIGSIAGAVPPVVGYLAVTNQIDLGACLLFVMLILWQMPHFFSIAIWRIKDYTAAAIPVLPIEKGMLRTKIHMVLYIIGFIVAAMLFTLFNYTGTTYLLLALLLGLSWLLLCLVGFKNKDDHLWAKQMFRLSLIVITVLSVTIPFDIAS